MTNRLSPQLKAYLALLVLVLIWGYNWVVMKTAVMYAGQSILPPCAWF